MKRPLLIIIMAKASIVLCSGKVFPNGRGQNLRSLYGKAEGSDNSVNIALSGFY